MKDDTKPGERPKRTAQENGNTDYKHMTKRELFAAMAMQGFCAKPNPPELQLCESADEGLALRFATYAFMSVFMADALLAELAREAE